MMLFLNARKESLKGKQKLGQRWDIMVQDAWHKVLAQTDQEFSPFCVCVFCYCVFLNTCDPGGCVWSVTRAQQVLTLDFFILVIEVCK